MQQFGSGDVVDLVSAMHPWVGRMRILTRLKHSQRMPFPRLEMEVGRGWRVSYDIDEVMKLVVLFEFLAVGVTPQIAARLVSTHWNSIASALSSALADEAKTDLRLMLNTTPDGLGLAAADALWIGPVEGWRDSHHSSTPPRGFVVVDLVATAGALSYAVEELSVSRRLSDLPAAVSGWVGVQVLRNMRLRSVAE